MSFLDSSLALKQTNIDELVQLGRSGDPNAVAEILERHRRLMQRTSFAIVKNAEDAEDVVQEACIRIFLKINTFQGSSALSTWITRIVINTSLMRLRQKRARPAASLEEITVGGESSFLPLADGGADPEQQCSSLQMKARLEKAVSRLPISLREVALDQIYGELPIKDLAIRRGLTIAAAKSRVYRARKILITVLETQPSDVWTDCRR